MVAPSAAVPGRTQAISSSVISSDGWAGREDAAGQPLQGCVELSFQGGCAGYGPAGVAPARSVDAAPLPVGAEHHLGMVGEILVDLDDTLPLVAAQLGLLAGCDIAHRFLLVLLLSCRLGRVEQQLAQVHPVHAARCLPLGAALKHQNIDNHFGPRGRSHAAFRQAHRADQVGEAGDVLAGGGRRLVHGPGAGDEERDAAGSQAADRAGDEVVVQAQP